jgi:Predicted membrane protein
MKNFFYRIFCGFFLGISIFAPGVSGSVMAVMMGIYHTLIDIVSNPFKNLKKNITYLFPMGIGALLSLVMFIVVFSYLFETYETATHLVFIGLIAGNLPVVFKDANSDGFKPKYAVGIACAFALAVGVGIVRLMMPETAVGVDMQVNFVYYAVSAVVAGIASMVPGMSISMILMVFGVYDRLMISAKTLLTAPNMHEFALAGIVGVCFVAAMIVFSNFTKYIIRRHHSFAYFMVFGFMCGSLVSIFLKLPKNEPNFSWLIGAIMLLIGVSISSLFVRLGRRFNKGDA